MANLSAILKTEITRLARREVNAQIGSLKEQVAKLRKDVAELKRVKGETDRVRRVEAKVAAVETAVSEAASDTKPRRFSAERLKGFREKMELSAPELGKLLGVSSQSIYNWESGAVRPNDEVIAAIARLKGVGKRKIRAALEQLRASSGQ